MRYLELFAGAGGMSLGLEDAGLTAVAHAEIEPHARAVLRHRWPETELLGDVVAVDGTAYRGRVDLVAGGSPCQDLSVAGKRAGLDGARSGLFHQQARIWADSEAPYLIWENVVGALSSQGGRDFAIVLSTLVGAAIPVPANGWRTSGVAAGATGVAAWRVFDLQHFGPPQRRRRVFVVAARAGGADPAEILALSESVCGHPSPRDQARKDASSSVVGRFVGGCVGTIETRPQRAGAHEAAQGHVVAFKPSHHTRGKDGAPSDVWPPLSADADRGDQEALAFDSYNQTTADVTHTLRDPNGTFGDTLPGVLAFHHTQDPISGDVSPAIGRPTDGMGVVGFDVAPTLGARDGKGPGNYQNGQLQATVFPAGRPRRLTPLECERLMGWPDRWTATGTREDGSTYQLSDSARYRLCGNGVGAPVAAWIGRQFMEAHAGLPPR